MARTLSSAVTKSTQGVDDYADDTPGEAGHSSVFLFDHYWWAPFLMIFVALLVSASTHRVEPYCFDGKVLRHDRTARITHWFNAAGILLLLYSGFMLGFLDFPRRVAFTEGARRMFDLHFWGALLFLFGAVYWVGNMFLQPRRLKEHEPYKGSTRDTVLHYLHLAGLPLKRTERPTGKYEASERLAFVPLTVLALFMALTGPVKLSARVVHLPDGLLVAATTTHDVSALLLVFHILLAAVVPWAWPMLGAMITGTMPLDLVKKSTSGGTGNWSNRAGAKNRRPERRGKMAEQTTEPRFGGMDRRTFLKTLSTAGITATAGAAFMLPGSDLMVMPNSHGFLVVDMAKCMGCTTCMMTCSLVHHGEASLSLSRIQIQQDSFQNFPNDIHMAVCHQCEDAPCVNACPVEADHVDIVHGNVRTIDPDRCIGCTQCIDACPWLPKRLQFNPETKKVQKCDLCANTPYLREKGGPGGTQSCVKVCPVGAIAFVEKMPKQHDPHAYNVNLRTQGWKELGMTTEDFELEG